MHAPQPHDPAAFLAAMHARHDAEQARHHRDERHRPLVFPAPEPRLTVAEREAIRWAHHRTDAGVTTVRGLRGATLALLVQEPSAEPQADGMRGPADEERHFCLLGVADRADAAVTEAFRRVAERGKVVIGAYDVKAGRALRVEEAAGAPRLVPDDTPGAPGGRGA
jgi:hypothetical protein